MFFIFDLYNVRSLKNCYRVFSLLSIMSFSQCQHHQQVDCEIMEASAQQRISMMLVEERWVETYPSTGRCNAPVWRGDLLSSRA
ncbi:hypothetical protein TNIN_141911 [Trichonephila inaurata madagascariensis]|uniref:Uncharacterized protein n=1 Tax=Trichonephila inaurata madagascariensis TaxID=2747483 RepID=A0A8X6II61_9ARAC|nr:hypothetical protein TNIN_141911 [Trichonephila inaurata madagascariensis]